MGSEADAAGLVARLTAAIADRAAPRGVAPELRVAEVSSARLELDVAFLRLGRRVAARASFDLMSLGTSDAEIGAMADVIVRAAESLFGKESPSHAT